MCDGSVLDLRTEGEGQSALETNLFGSLDGIAGRIPDLRRRAGVDLIIQLKHSQFRSSVT